MKEYIMEMKQFGKNTFGYEQKQELVRCKDCKYACPDMVCGHENEWGNEVSRNSGNPDWFCADGEAKQ